MNVINEMLNLPFLSRKKKKHHLKKCSKKVPNPSSFLDDSSNDSTAESVQSSGTVNGSEKSISSCSGSSASVISISSSTTKESEYSKESISNEELLYGNTLNISVDSMPVII